MFQSGRVETVFRAVRSDDGQGHRAQVGVARQAPGALHVQRSQETGLRRGIQVQAHSDIPYEMLSIILPIIFIHWRSVTFSS